MQLAWTHNLSSEFDRQIGESANTAHIAAALTYRQNCTTAPGHFKEKIAGS